MRWLLHCNTCSPRKHQPSAPCSAFLSNNYMNVNACSRNITGSTNLVYSQKINQQDPIRLSFQGLSLSGTEKLTKCTYFVIEPCFNHPPLIFDTQSLTISLQLIKLCISLLSQSLWIFWINLCHERSSINSQSYFGKVVISKTLGYYC